MGYRFYEAKFKTRNTRPSNETEFLAAVTKKLCGSQIPFQVGAKNQRTDYCLVAMFSLVAEHNHSQGSVPYPFFKRSVRTSRSISTINESAPGFFSIKL